MNQLGKKRSITKKQVIKHFKQRNIELSESDAEKYLDLLYFFADTVVQQNLLPGNGSYISRAKDIEPDFKKKKSK